MSNTTGIQDTRTHSEAHVSQQRSDVILIMKVIRNQVEQGWKRAKKIVVLENGCIWSSVVMNVRQGANHRIRGAGESHQTSGTIMIKVHCYCYRSSLW